MMKKLILFITLLVVSASPIIFIIGLYNNIAIWKYCPLGSGYLCAFSISYFTDDTNNIIWVALFVALVNILMVFSAIMAYIRNIRWGYLAISVFVIDILISIFAGLYIVVLIDIVICLLLIAIGKRNGETYIDGTFIP